jgi:prefoldin subunit 5
MVDTTDIEKKSLEAHVELCAERYRYLEDKLETVESKITSLNKTVSEIRDMMQSIVAKRNDQLINWGVGIIVFLAGSVGYLLSHYVLK